MSKHSRSTIDNHSTEHIDQDTASSSLDYLKVQGIWYIKL